MAIWGIVLFLLGLLAWVTNIFSALSWFIPWWAIGLMVISFTMLMKICDREKDGEKEKLNERIHELEGLLRF